MWGIEKSQEVALFKDGALDLIQVCESRLAAIGVAPTIIRRSDFGGTGVGTAPAMQAGFECGTPLFPGYLPAGPNAT